MSTGAVLRITRTTSPAQDLTTSPKPIFSHSTQYNAPRPWASNLTCRAAHFPIKGLSTSFSSPTKDNQRCNATARGQENARVKLRCRRRLRSTSLKRYCNIKYESQTNCNLGQCAEDNLGEEQQEISPQVDRGRDNRAGEKSSPTTERKSPNKSRPALAPGKSLEIRLLHRLNRTLTDRQLLAPGQKILIAVSGGQDSVCLLHLLAKLQSQWQWKIGVAHCDHQWTSSARQQAEHVAQVVQGLGLDYYQALTVEAVPGEGAARTWRYGVLQRIATSHGFEAIVTAHTASDRVETSLFNIFRGSGLQGLQSLTWQRSLPPGMSLTQKVAFRVTEPVERIEDPQDGTISISDNLGFRVSLVRPLLNFTRTELRELWMEMRLPLWPDPSNSSLEIDRNRIRHELLPYLRKYFNSGVDRSLARWAEILHGEEEYLDSVCDGIRGFAVSEVRASPGGELVGRKLDLSVWRDLPRAIQRRVLKQFSDRFTGKSLGFDVVERVRQACGERGVGGKRSLQVSVPGNCYLLVCGDELMVGRSPLREVGD